jgi:hypothetical protein
MKNTIRLIAVGGMVYNVIKGDFQMAIFFGICALLMK